MITVKLGDKCLQLRHGTLAQNSQPVHEAGGISSPLLPVIQSLMHNIQTSQYARLKDTTGRSAVAGSMTGSLMPTSKGHVLSRSSSANFVPLYI